MNPRLINKLKEFNNHKLVMSLYNDSGNLMGFIAIHRGSFNAPSFGATRIWKYTSEAEALKDALRLSSLMSYKAALAGLPYGGAKAVLFTADDKPSNRKAVITNYTQKINYLRGSFITGADVGINTEDLTLMRKESKYIVGVSTDPVKLTIQGVYHALQVCLEETFGNESVQGRSFAIQGLGKTGYALLKLLYPNAAKIFVCDIDKKKVAIAKKEFPKIAVVPPSEIFKQAVDVYCPCALGNIITSRNLSSLRCKVIVGSANNQLENKQIGSKLYSKGILYAPDYVVNAGGLIAVVEEYENPRVNVKRISEKVLGIKKILKSIISHSKKKGEATNLVADSMAEAIFEKVR